MPRTSSCARLAFAAASVVSSNSSTMPSPPLSSVEFRHALGQFATGVTIVTADRGPGMVHGMTASSFASVSLEPPLVLVCVAHRANMLPILQREKRFGINILKDDQQSISEYFALSEQNASDEHALGIRFRWSPSGIPLLENTLVQLGCNVVAAYVSGDHTIFIGEVEFAEIHPGAPLLHCRGDYHRLAPLH
jgi:flavin reductase (DIM6/NTAB) family NADH-FMN oxidoreductase RutF